MKRKMMIAMLVLVSIGVLAFAATRNYPTEPASFDVGVDSLMIMAPRMVKAKDWVAGTLYSHGDMVRNTNRRNKVYWNVNGSTNGIAAVTCPSHLKDDATEASGTNVWRRIPPHSRMGFVVENEGSNTVWIAIGYPAVVSSGFALLPDGTFWVDGEDLQDYVSAISFCTTNNVTTTEY